MRAADVALINVKRTTQPGPLERHRLIAAADRSPGMPCPSSRSAPPPTSPTDSSPGSDPRTGSMGTRVMRLADLVPLIRAAGWGTPLDGAA